MANPVTKANGKIPTFRVNKDEVTLAFGMLAGLQEMKKAEETMERRFRAIPNGWRNLRMIESVYEKLIDDLLQTYPLEKLISMERMMPHMKYKVTCGVQPSKMGDDECIITENNLNTLCLAAHEQCKLCFDNNCKRCKLGKVLDNILCYDREDRSWANIDIGGMTDANDNSGR